MVSRCNKAGVHTINDSNLCCEHFEKTLNNMCESTNEISYYKNNKSLLGNNKKFRTSYALLRQSIMSTKGRIIIDNDGIRID